VTGERIAGWRSLGTGVRLVVVGGSVATARRAVEDILDRVDRTYSRFRDDSEITSLNARAGSAVVVSPLLAEAIAVGLRAAMLSGGAVDPTVGRAMRAVGYDADFERIRSDGGPIELRLEPIPGWRSTGSTPAMRSSRASSSASAARTRFAASTSAS